MLAHRTYQQRGYCRRNGYQRLETTLALCAELYNAALQERRDAWKLQRHTVRYPDQSAALTEIRGELPEWSALDVTVGRGVLRRVDRAFGAFFRRARNSERPGYPRFKPRRRYRTIELSEARPGMVRLSADGRRAIVRVKGLPAIELRLKRELPPAEQMRSLRIVFRGEKLYVGLVFAEEVAPLAPTGRNAGIDLGVNSRVALSDGTLVDGRTPDRRRERRLRRALSRCRRGSRGRVKRRAQLARETQRNRVRNRGAAHELTTTLVQRYDRIAVEDLRIGNMTRSAKGTLEEPGRNVAAKQALNRRILDQSWGLILTQLTYKAEWAGRELVRVNPAYTSRTCSGCGASAPQERYRVYGCPDCGLLLDRDVNAARNILARAFPGLPGLPGDANEPKNGAGDAPRSAQSAQADALAIVA